MIIWFGTMLETTQLIRLSHKLKSQQGYMLYFLIVMVKAATIFFLLFLFLNFEMGDLNASRVSAMNTPFFQSLNLIDILFLEGLNA